MVDACGVVLPDYSGCCETTLPSVPPPPTTGPPGPQGPPGPPGTSCPLFCGLGSPEGVITSPIGGIYEQTDAALLSHSVWFKNSGVGNTGWRQWAGMRGTDGASTSLRMGDNSIATGADSIAYGEGAQALADRVIAIGKGARGDAVEGISLGDGRARSINDISIGWSHEFGAAVAHGSVLIGKNATILTGVDSSSSVPANYGGHILIGEDTETPYAETEFQNVVIGFKAKARGRACFIIGQEAESRAAANPVAALPEGRFAVAIGYRAKVSGGCVVAVGDQADVRGNNAVGVGTNVRANDSNTLALGPGAFAGSLTSDGTGTFSTAVGPSALARGNNAVALGQAFARSADSIAIGHGASVGDLHPGAICIGDRSVSTTPNQIQIAGFFANRIFALYFNGSTSPAMLVTYDGQIQLVNPLTAQTVAMPIAGNHNATATDENLFFSTSGGNRTLNLPAIASVAVGKRYFVRKDTADANTVTIEPNGAETFDGDPNYVIDSLFEWVAFESDGVEWVSFDFDDP